MIRKGTLSDIRELQELFVGSVLAICKPDYNSEQLSVWSSDIKNNERWHNILTNQLVLVAQKDGKITGFSTLDGNHIDLFYVHKDHQREGIGLKLYEEIEKAARKQGQSELTSDVSVTAKPFFEKVGFGVIKKQKVTIDSVELTNFKMTKLME